MKRRATVLAVWTVLMAVSAGWGLPAFRAEGRPYARGLRYEVWHDSKGWHLRWSGGRGTHHFRGRIWSPGGHVVLLRTVEFERGDNIRTTPKEIGFKAVCSGGMDGIDFRWRGRRLFLELLIDGTYRPQRIFIGSEGYHPEASPFVIVREKI